MQSCSELATDAAYDLVIRWINDTDSCPPGGPSNEEVNGVLQSDTLVATPPTESVATPIGVHPTGSEEVSPHSMSSKEGGNVVPKSRGMQNLPVMEDPISSASEEDRGPYIMTWIPNLDSMTLRCSRQTPKPLEVVRENRKQQKEDTHHKTKTTSSFYELFTMFTLCTSSIITSSASALSTSVAHKMAYHAEKIKSNFDGTLNSLNYMAILSSASDNDTYTFNDMLHQPDVTTSYKQ